jgi:hypothetical protein
LPSDTAVGDADGEALGVGVPEVGVTLGVGPAEVDVLGCDEPSGVGVGV